MAQKLSRFTPLAVVLEVDLGAHQRLAHKRAVAVAAGEEPALLSPLTLRFLVPPKQ